MASPPFLDLSDFDLQQAAISGDRLRRLLPQRHEFEMIDRIALLDPERRLAIAVKELTPEDWWCRGHFPGSPILPGILMIEGAAQVGSVLWKAVADLPDEQLIGFGGVDEVRFRGRVEPPCTLVYVASGGRYRSRLASLPTQVFVDGEMVCEATILGASLS